MTSYPPRTTTASSRSCTSSWSSCSNGWSHKGLKVCIVFEGRDGAGKGGTIKAITERVSPRVFRVIALPAPTEREKSQMYAQRYLPHFPAAGEIVIFDRSWYNRAGVERVMGFCTEEQARGFLKVVPLFEKMMINSGIILLKYWLEVSPEEQTRRLEARIGDGRKTWKLSPMDLKSYDRWDDYTKARDEMFAATDSSWAPWFVARSEDKKRVRLNVISHLLKHVPYKAHPGARRSSCPSARSAATRRSTFRSNTCRKSSDRDAGTACAAAPTVRDSAVESPLARLLAASGLRFKGCAGPGSQTGCARGCLLIVLFAGPLPSRAVDFL